MDNPYVPTCQRDPKSSEKRTPSDFCWIVLFQGHMFSRFVGCWLLGCQIHESQPRRCHCSLWHAWWRATISRQWRSHAMRSELCGMVKRQVKRLVPWNIHSCVPLPSWPKTQVPFCLMLGSGGQFFLGIRLYELWIPLKKQNWRHHFKNTLKTPFFSFDLEPWR